MNNMCFSINKNIQRGKITGLLCIVSLVFIFTGLPCTSFGSDNGFTVFWVEIDETPEMNKNSGPVKDLYINGGEDDGLSVSMVLDVYREKVIRDSVKEQDHTISILVGQVKIMRLFKDVAITKIISLIPPTDNPVLRYRTVMIGDHAVLRRIQKAAKADKLIPVADKGEGVIIPSKVLFELNGWKLKAAAMETLSVVNDTYNKSKNKDIIIEGHTCSIGKEKYNLELSRKRAQSVSDYLVNAIGIQKDKVRIEYYGEKSPIVSNDSEKGRSRNRRVEIRFLPLKTKDSSPPSLERPSHIIGKRGF